MAVMPFLSPSVVEPSSHIKREEVHHRHRHEVGVGDHHLPRATMSGVAQLFLTRLMMIGWSFFESPAMAYFPTFPSCPSRGSRVLAPKLGQVRRVEHLAPELRSRPARRMATASRPAASVLVHCSSLPASSTFLLLEEARPAARRRRRRAGCQGTCRPARSRSSRPGPRRAGSQSPSCSRYAQHRSNDTEGRQAAGQALARWRRRRRVPRLVMGLVLPVHQRRRSRGRCRGCPRPSSRR